MPFDQEPGYQIFQYMCQCCGELYQEPGSIKKHPDYQYCEECEKERNET